MDSLTHGMLGAVTAQLGFRQKTGRDAAWVAAAAAILPDLDMFVTPFLSLTGAEVDSMTRAVVHRGLSHSLLMTPILSLPVALIWWWLRRRRNRSDAENLTDGNAQEPPATTARAARFGLLYACVFVALLSAPLLDGCTSYGTQLLSPVTNARYAIDAVPIVDIIYTPLLILTLLGCRIVRKACRGPGVRATLIVAWTGFILSVGYIAAGRAMHDWAAEKAVRAAGEPAVLRTDAYPAPGTIFLWRTVVETEDEWIVTRIHLFSDKPGDEWPRTTAAKADNRWIRKARRLGEVRTYHWFAGGRVRANYFQEGDHRVVEFHDMRYGRPVESAESLWPMIVIFDGAGQVRHVARRRAPRGRFSDLAAKAWSDIWNP